MRVRFLRKRAAPIKTEEKVEGPLVVEGELAPITLFTFFLELPFALPLPENMNTVTVGEPGDQHWVGWTDEHVAQLFTREEATFPPRLGPGTRIAVRQVSVNERVPLFVAEEAFADWVDELFPEDQQAERAAKREEWRDVGMDVVRSVVALSRYVPRSAHPRGRDMTVGWVLSQFRAALQDFNELLEALGFVLGRWDVGAVSLRDLPAQVPVLIGSTHLGAQNKPQGITFTAQIHDAYPVLAEKFAPEQGPANDAVQLSNLARHGEQPYMLVFRLIHSAVSERLAGDATRAMIDLNTAIEVLVSVTVNEGGPLVGLTAQDLADANRPGVKRRVRTYLARMFQEELDVNNAETPWGKWFSDGYMRRNEAVHQGLPVDKDAVDRAFQQAGEVVAEVKRQLEAREPLQDLASKLALEFGGGDPSFEKESLPIAFPWD